MERTKEKDRKKSQEEKTGRIPKNTVKSASVPADFVLILYIRAWIFTLTFTLQRSPGTVWAWFDAKTGCQEVRRIL